MPEPTTPAAAALVAIVSNFTLALFGVDYYSLLYGFVGSLLALTQSERMGRWRSMTFVCLSTMVGAAGGNAAIAFYGKESRPFLMVASIVVGCGALLIVSAAVKGIVNRIKQAGGQHD